MFSCDLTVEQLKGVSLTGSHLQTVWEAFSHTGQTQLREVIPGMSPAGTETGVVSWNETFSVADISPALAQQHSIEIAIWEYMSDSEEPRAVGFGKWDLPDFGVDDSQQIPLGLVIEGCETELTVHVQTYPSTAKSASDAQQRVRPADLPGSPVSESPRSPDAVNGYVADDSSVDVRQEDDELEGHFSDQSTPHKAHKVEVPEPTSHLSDSVEDDLATPKQPIHSDTDTTLLDSLACSQGAPNVPLTDEGGVAPAPVQGEREPPGEDVPPTEIHVIAPDPPLTPPALHSTSVQPEPASPPSEKIIQPEHDDIGNNGEQTCDADGVDGDLAWHICSSLLPLALPPQVTPSESPPTPLYPVLPEAVMDISASPLGDVSKAVSAAIGLILPDFKANETAQAARPWPLTAQEEGVMCDLLTQAILASTDSRSRSTALTDVTVRCLTQLVGLPNRALAQAHADMASATLSALRAAMTKDSLHPTMDRPSPVVYLPVDHSESSVAHLGMSLETLRALLPNITFRGVPTRNGVQHAPMCTDSFLSMFQEDESNVLRRPAVMIVPFDTFLDGPQPDPSTALDAVLALCLQRGLWLHIASGAALPFAFAAGFDGGQTTGHPLASAFRSKITAAAGVIGLSFAIDGRQVIGGSFPLNSLSSTSRSFWTLACSTEGSSITMPSTGDVRNHLTSVLPTYLRLRAFGTNAMAAATRNRLATAEDIIRVVASEPTAELLSTPEQVFRVSFRLRPDATGSASNNRMNTSLYNLLVTLEAPPSSPSASSSTSCFRLDPIHPSVEDTSSLSISFQPLLQDCHPEIAKRVGDAVGAMGYAVRLLVVLTPTVQSMLSSCSFIQVTPPGSSLFVTSDPFVIATFDFVPQSPLESQLLSADDISELNRELVATLQGHDSAFWPIVSAGRTIVACGIPLKALGSPVALRSLFTSEHLSHLKTVLTEMGRILDDHPVMKRVQAEVIKNGIRQAEEEMKHRAESESSLRYVPVIGSLTNWWYPPQDGMEDSLSFDLRTQKLKHNHLTPLVADNPTA